MTKRIAIWLSIPLMCLVLGGCAEKLTYQRWDTIHNGESPEAVKATLGDPWQKTDMAWVYFDDERHVNAYVYFKGDQVIGKTWSDPERGMVGSSPNVNQPGDTEQIKVQTVK